MDFGDIFAELASAGADNGGWRSWFVRVTALLGLMLGAYIGWRMDGWLWAVGGALLGAPAGWLLGVLLRGVWMFFAFFAVFAAALALISWLGGGL